MEDQAPKTSSKRRDSSEVADPPNKRRRIALACSACRTRKSRVSATFEPRRASPCPCGDYERRVKLILSSATGRDRVVLSAQTWVSNVSMCNQLLQPM